MSISAPGGIGSPIICGTNTGQHMILDTTPSKGCHVVNINVGATTTTSRVWDIRVTQYSCGEVDSSGPPGCLQYYTNTYNIIQNFAWGDVSKAVTATSVGATQSHLSSQHYDICIRRAKGYCYICYSPTIHAATPASITVQNSYGIGVSSSAPTSKSAGNTFCSGDWLEIPSGETKAKALLTTFVDSEEIVTQYRWCGRFLNVGNTGTTNTSICTRRRPFVVGVNFNENELTKDATITNKGTTVETFSHPGGIIGFQLTYEQHSC